MVYMVQDGPIRLGDQLISTITVLLLLERYSNVFVFSASLSRALHTIANGFQNSLKKCSPNKIPVDRRNIQNGELLDRQGTGESPAIRTL
jgi:hypothetical protein